MICDWQKHFPLIFQTNQYVLGLRTQTSKAKGIRDVYTKSLPALPARVTRLHVTRLITLSCVWFVGFSVFWRYKITTSLKYQIIVKKMYHTKRLVGIVNKSASKLIKASLLSSLFLTISASGT